MLLSGTFRIRLRREDVYSEKGKCYCRNFTAGLPNEIQCIECDRIFEKLEGYHDHVGQDLNCWPDQIPDRCFVTAEERKRVQATSSFPGRRERRRKKY